MSCELVNKTQSVKNTKGNYIMTVINLLNNLSCIIFVKKWKKIMFSQLKIELLHVAKSHL